MSDCARCGNCCYIVDKKTMVQTEIPCKYLIFNEDGTTKCKIYYRNRVGRDIGHGNKCRLRKDVPVDYPGCSMNSGKPMIESLRV